MKKQENTKQWSGDEVDFGQKLMHVEWFPNIVAFISDPGSNRNVASWHPKPITSTIFFLQSVRKTRDPISTSFFSLISSIMSFPINPPVSSSEITDETLRNWAERYRRSLYLIIEMIQLVLKHECKNRINKNNKY